MSYYGRTDKAQIPAHLTNRLIDLFGGDVNEEMFEQKFGEMEVELIGEGYGIKIQNGGGYRYAGPKAWGNPYNKPTETFEVELEDFIKCLEQNSYEQELKGSDK